MATFILAGFLYLSGCAMTEGAHTRGRTRITFAGLSCLLALLGGVGYSVLS